MKVTKVYGADVCRDGGSYSLSFEANDGEWCEFFVEVKGMESNQYFEPKLYKGGVNEGLEIEAYSWVSAKTFLSEITYSGERFHELVQLVKNNGIIT